MKSKVAERILNNTPEDIKIFVRLYADLVVRINSILKEKGLNQKALAEKLDKRPSEIHKWLNGSHNFTLRSLAKLEAELGEPLLEVPFSRKYSNFVPGIGTNTFTVHTGKTELHKKKKAVWEPVNTFDQTEPIENVG